MHVVHINRLDRPRGRTPGWTESQCQLGYRNRTFDDASDVIWVDRDREQRTNAMDTLASHWLRTYEPLAAIDWVKHIEGIGHARQRP